MKTVLITGGAGFIGSHLCEKNLNAGNRVICIDNLGSGQEENVKIFQQHPQFEFVKHNIIEPLPESITKKKYDEIFHFASRASPPDYQNYQIETMMTNGFGTKRLLDLAVKNNAKIMFASTSECYGSPLEHPQKESYWGHVNPVGIRSCYDESKRFGEAIMMAYLREKKVRIKIIRIFNTYGPRMRADDGRVVTNFINQALQGKALTVYGDGKQTRSFCYVADLIEGIMKMMNSEDGFTGPVNLGNPVEYSILEFAEYVKNKLTPDIDITFKELPKDDPPQRRPDISLAKERLQWEPKTSLQEGLKTTIAYFQKTM